MADMSEPAEGAQAAGVQSQRLLRLMVANEPAAECVKGCAQKTLTVADFIACCAQCAKLFPNLPSPRTE